MGRTWFCKHKVTWCVEQRRLTSDNSKAGLLAYGCDSVPVRLDRIAFCSYAPPSQVLSTGIQPPTHTMTMSTGST